VICALVANRLCDPRPLYDMGAGPLEGFMRVRG
jgi:hypothetical protein